MYLPLAICDDYLSRHPDIKERQSAVMHYQFEHNGAEHFDQFSQTEDRAHQHTITCRCVQLAAYLVAEALLNSHFSIWWGWGLLSLRIKELNDIHGMLDNSQRGSKAWIENGRNVSSHRQCFKIGQHLKYRQRKVSSHSNVFT